MSANMAPALVSNATDLVQYRIEDSQPIDTSAPRGYIERFIHSEIYKRYPDVNSVIHSHSPEVLPYAIAGVPLRAVYHMAGFLGTGPVPLWDFEDSYNATEPHDLLVRTEKLGADLANSFLAPENATANPPAPIPDHSVVLMRKHGFTTYGVDVKEAVVRAVYTQDNAEAQTKAAMIRGAFEALTERQAQAWTGGVNTTAFEPLTVQQALDTAPAIRATSDRPWGLWLREVEVQPLYKNNA